MDEEWGFSERTDSSLTAGWGFETERSVTSCLAYSELEVQAVNARNRTRRIMTTIPEFTTLLAQAGLRGPRNIMLPGLDSSSWAKKVGAGAQFTVFLDTRPPLALQNTVIKRVNVFDTYNDQQPNLDDANFRKQLHTIETEILALCHPPLRNHRNIVTLLEWGYDYRDDSNSVSAPVLYVESALCSLSGFLTQEDFMSRSSLPQDTIRYQLCLDVAEGLAAMHKYGIVHGDIKPDNILIFRQADPKVPYIAKLSDFGVCVALEGESVSIDFTSYRGTPGWRPPEAAKYVEDIHGPFTPELLLRYDSFSYGLLVLSVLATGGRPPLSKSPEGASEGLYSLMSFVSNAVSILPGGGYTEKPAVSHGSMPLNPLDDALAVLDRATHLRESLRTRVRSLLPRVLQIKPGKRDLVDSGMLADDEEDGYLDWYIRHQKDSQRQLTTEPSVKDPGSQQGTRYWLKLDLRRLQKLDEQYDSLVRQGEDPMFPGETLHGMAIAYLSSEPGRGTHKENIDKALMYMRASALEGFYPAQGICERLHRGLGRTLPDDIDEKTRSQWLYNAASTGSLLANEILMKSDRNLYTSARSEFRKNGGYNDTHTRTVQVQAKLLEDPHLADIIEKQDINNYVVDTRGNRMLHLASMVGSIEATRSLLSLKSIDVNIRNDIGETPLLLACKSGHAGIVKLLVDSDADASIFSNDSFSVGPLHWLFNFETDEIPDIGRMLVLKANASINHRVTPRKSKVLIGTGHHYRYGQIQTWHFPFEWPYGTTLHWATFSGSQAAIDVLCELGADIDALDLQVSDYALTPLSMAANRVDVKMVEYLLKKGACPTKTDQKGRSPLHFLSEDIHCWRWGLLGWRGLRDWVLCGTSAEHRLKVDSIVKLLLEAGCDIEGTGLWGRDFPLTPLAYTTGRKLVLDANVALSLIESGAKIDVPISTERSLLQEWAVVNPGSLVYSDNHTAILTTLIAKSGTKVLKHRDPLGYTFLGDIMRNPWLSFQTVCQAVECYKAAGCSLDDLNSQDKNGYTPLHSALNRYRSKFKQVTLVQVIETLWSWGVDLTATSNNKQNALHLLGQNERLDDLSSLRCLQLFKEKIPTPQFVKMIGQQNNYGWTPLMFMAKFAKLECVKWFVEEGVNTEELCTSHSELNWTALDFVLHEAERYRRWFLFEMHLYETNTIVAHGYLWSAQHRSDDLKESFPRVFQYLRSKGAKRGSELGFKTEGLHSPLEFDKREDGKYVQTPEEWKFVYELENHPPIEPPSALVGYLAKLFEW